MGPQQCHMLWVNIFENICRLSGPYPWSILSLHIFVVLFYLCILFCVWWVGRGDAHPPHTSQFRLYVIFPGFGEEMLISLTFTPCSSTHPPQNMLGLLTFSYFRFFFPYTHQKLVEAFLHTGKHFRKLLWVLNNAMYCGRTFSRTFGSSHSFCEHS